MEGVRYCGSLPRVPACLKTFPILPENPRYVDSAGEQRNSFRMGQRSPLQRCFQSVPSVVSLPALTTDYDKGKVTAGLTQPEVSARCSPR